MKCPECGTKNTQQLLVSYLCPNKNCKNYDTKQDLVAFFKERNAKHEQMLRMMGEMPAKPPYRPSKEAEDAMEKAMQAYLKRKPQINMLKDLGEIK